MKGNDAIMEYGSYFNKITKENANMSYYTPLAFEIAFGTRLINFFLVHFNLYREECDFYHLNPIGKMIFMSF